MRSRGEDLGQAKEGKHQMLNHWGEILPVCKCSRVMRCSVLYYLHSIARCEVLQCAPFATEDCLV